MKMWFSRSAGGNPGWNNWPHLTQRSFSSCFFTGQAKTDESKSQESVRDIRSLKTRRNSAPALVFANEESMDLAELEPRISNSYRERSRRLSEIINPFPQTNQPERNSGFFPSLNWLNWISFMRSKKIADSNLRFLIPKKLAFISVTMENLESVKDFFQRDSDLNFKLISSQMHKRYWPLCADFGPVGLSIVHRFCRLITKAMAMTDTDGSVLVYYIEPEAAARANASFLLAAYLILCSGFSPVDAASSFLGPTAPFVPLPFRDASYLPPDYPLTLIDCLMGLQRAVALGWYDLAKFDVEVRLDCCAHSHTERASMLHGECILGSPTYPLILRVHYCAFAPLLRTRVQIQALHQRIYEFPRRPIFKRPASSLRQAVWFALTLGSTHQAYDTLDDPEVADLHCVCPNLIAFKGPLSIGSHYQV